MIGCNTRSKFIRSESSLHSTTIPSSSPSPSTSLAVGTNCSTKSAMQTTSRTSMHSHVLSCVSASHTEDTQDSNMMELAMDYDLCMMHGKLVKFYCLSCKQSICEGCFMGMTEAPHRDHTFKVLSVAYEEHVTLFKNELEKVQQYRDKLAILSDKIDRNVARIGRVKLEKQKELEAIMASALKSLDRQQEEKLTKLRDRQTSVLNEIDYIDKELGTIRYQLEFRNPKTLIELQSGVFNLCNEVHNKPIQDFKQISDETSFKIEIPHLCETGIFEMHNFSTVEDKTIYSNEFSDCFGCRWRLMAHCEIVEEQFGIYLELVNGNPSWIEFTFQLIHLNPKLTISKTFRKNFGEALSNIWGYNNFVTLATIKEKNYLRDNGSLELLYKIRPCSSTDTQPLTTQ